MILITSAAYVNPEFRAEFGLLPPAMLPLGNKRLVEHQIEVLRQAFPNDPIAVSLPATYTLSPNEQRIFWLSGITLLPVPDGLSLWESIAHALSLLTKNSDNSDTTLRVLYGDTLILDLPSALDCVALAQTEDDYAWEFEGAAENANVWCGFFGFSNVPLLLEHMSQNKDFIGAVRAYGKSTPLTLTKVSEWLDFGHINTFFKSRSKFTTQRSFNALLIADGCVRKTGEPAKKIVAEMRWFEQIPRHLRVYAPQLIDAQPNHQPPFYVLEYLPLPPLNEVFVHGQNDRTYWRNVIRQCSRFLGFCAKESLTVEQIASVAQDFDSLVRAKTYERLNQYLSQQHALSLDSRVSVNGMTAAPLGQLVEDCIARVQELPAVPGVMHGDFCFSNILFDSRTGNIKVIDPRGMNISGELTMLGDLKYDLAKLTHSLLGLYDHIVAGAFDCTVSGDTANPDFTLVIYGEDKISKLQGEFLELEFFDGVTMQSIMPLVVLLFLSMIPLHADKPDRQTAFMANAIRLYTSFVI
jgi:fructosamine-3-kinase